MAASYRLFTTAQTGGLPGTTDGVAVSSTNTYYSVPIRPRGDGLSIHIQHTSTAAGTITMWISNKPDPDLTDDDDWVQVAHNLTNPAGSAGKSSEELGNLRAALVRWKYVNSSGSGTLYAWAAVSGA